MARNTSMDPREYALSVVTDEMDRADDNTEPGQEPPDAAYYLADVLLQVAAELGALLTGDSDAGTDAREAVCGAFYDALRPYQTTTG